ncbi:N-methylhydantoinase A (plasmid) [Mesorhizobium sp. 131-3-5]|uniref:hydantoinase/oxoprolinase family protein n=1 Tax=Mesorhizobium sp. 131-3-5 TaxID=2744520 RepID=UPI0018ED0FF7|nr:hydantoinase/oxoprolinase family protein [Mesorhizobium sp. 131-3-5]BCH12351.1 N-methylhydantoinase A [Mesorhizobium sp. 131-3-5]
MSDTTVKSNLKSPWRIGIDVGGTFTDFVLIDANDKVVPYKSPSEPSNPAVGVIRAVEGAAAFLDLSVFDLLSGCSHFIHGTTVATNILLERKGANVGLLTTLGFRDTLEIRRGYREMMWDHRTPWGDVLVRRKLRQPVIERVSATGEIVTKLDEQSVRTAAARFKAEAVEAVAICLLHSYANPAHEQRCAAILAEELPGVYVTSSSELAPIIGEYERVSTTVANAYVGPRVLPYLNELRGELLKKGLARELLLIQSNGGAISLDQIGDRPAALALSGPAAGLASLRLYGKALGVSHLISIEIGGTSCDVTVVSNDEVAETDSIKVGDTLISLPSVEIHTIATGGGTICGVDAGGLLYAGPEGAGARPGPACYGLGGTRATTTDSQLALGRLRAGSYANGKLSLDRDLANAAIDRDVASPLGVSTTDGANAIIRLVEQKIRHSVEKVSLERGLDPAKFVLVGAGGAGALHVAEVARRLGMREAFVPRLAGVFCALGMCNADVRHDLLRSVGNVLRPATAAALEAGFVELERDGIAKLEADGFRRDEMRFDNKIDLRYAGQQWPITLKVDSLDPSKLRQRFDEEHEKLYGSSQPGANIEIVNIRLSAIGRLPSLSVDAEAAGQKCPAPVADRRPAVVGDGSGRLINMPILQGNDLKPGHYFHGPAIVEEITTTILIGPGDEIQVDVHGNYRIFIGKAPAGADNV